MDCIFCKIVKGELPSFKIYEDEKSLAFLDINPIRPGHTILIPKDHYRDLLDTPDELLEHLIKVGKKVARAVKLGTGSDAINFTHNNGAASGQIIFHTHFHVIPRKANDGLSSWPHGKYQEGQAEKIAGEIKTKF